MKLPAIFGFLLLASALGGQEDEPQEPVVAAASDEGRLALDSFQISPPLRGELVAAEPQVANPVAFAIDAQGQIYVCETFRQENGVTDNRSHDETWIDHDLAAQTVADRIAYHQKLLSGEGSSYRQQQDRVRILRDNDKDGTYDESLIYADQFHELEDGTAAGILPLDSHVLFACIPHIWALRDGDHDGRAEFREPLLSGFGVRVAFRGHDLHGLTRGPDGRIYFSVGDRGYHVVSREGRVLADPESGAVFRCETDGTELEVFATGLRNPQELAFDQFGNLFTGDNNSDSGDRARWVHVVQGADSGWRMAYQYLSDRGPFNREKIWHLFHREQPAYIVPPVANLGDGPSGLAYYPGTGFASNFHDCFFLCDFRGSSADSGIRAIRVRNEGASFRLESEQRPLWRILATDLEFGPDGYLYVSDWVSGWVGEGKGRIYRFADPDTVTTAAVSEVQRLLRGGIRAAQSRDLAPLLGHVDQRVRMAAQFELVARGDLAELVAISNSGHPLLARLHGLWGWSQYSRLQRRPDLIDSMSHFLRDDEVEVRTLVARTLGEHSIQSAECELIARLADPSARVRSAAAHSLGQIRSELALQPLIELLADNDDRDPVLRHAAIMGLTGTAPELVARQTMGHPSIAVRRAAVVALRRQQSTLVRSFLNDAELLVAEEAARAIHDGRILAAEPDLAAAWERFPQSVSLSHRAATANYRQGTAPAADRLAQLAVDERFPSIVRTEAIWMLAHWQSPPSRDRVLGMWRPIAARTAEPAARALAARLSQIVELENEGLVLAALESVGELRIAAAADDLRKLVQNSDLSPTIRGGALLAWARLETSDMAAAATAALSDAEASVRSAARRALLDVAPEIAIESASIAVDSMDLRERQVAWDMLCRASSETARAVVESHLRKLLGNEITADTRLDLVRCAEAWCERCPTIDGLLTQYRSQYSDEITAAFRDCLEGGDAAQGRKIFHEQMQVYCLRCHRVGTEGGAVGPDLSQIGGKKDRQYLMESIVDPNRAIAENYETVVIINDLGKSISGIVQSETDDFLRLTTADGSLVTVAKSSIDERRRGKSSMPEDLVRHLTPGEVRDLVEFLKQQAPPDVENGGPQISDTLNSPQR